MRQRIEWTPAKKAQVSVVTPETIEDSWNLDVAPWDDGSPILGAPFGLGLFSPNGDGLSVAGTADELVEFAERILRIVQRLVDHAA
ncbi:hypothetical protein [Mycolicibacterium sphagni]|uniref:Uncharacterized protein n=1 Tax=Mycolicibacterium sphagni TaxID=1786 RepID=A0ABX2K581_9MYCO|nr:hypothetical protein [Mycolicibacterium sphagni]NTY62206.1 hypothetical protein [Mycolicibacterium sphagni]